MSRSGADPSHFYSNLLHNSLAPGMDDEHPPRDVDSCSPGAPIASKKMRRLAPLRGAGSAAYQRSCKGEAPPARKSLIDENLADAITSATRVSKDRAAPRLPQRTRRQHRPATSGATTLLRRARERYLSERSDKRRGQRGWSRIPNNTMVGGGLSVGVHGS